MSQRSPFLLMIAVLFLLALPARHAWATQTFCVSSAAQLDNVLSAWQSASNDTYEVHVVQGTYLLSGQSFYYYSQPYFGGNASLYLRGGYTANCASRQFSATATVIDGNNGANDEFGLYAQGNVLVEWLTFQNFTRPFDVTSNASTSYSTEIRYCIVRNNNLGNWSANLGVLDIAGSNTERIHDVLVVNNVPPSGGAAVVVLTSQSGTAKVYNATIVGNQGPGLMLWSGNGNTLLAQNDIVWSNTTTDVIGKTDSGAAAPTIAYSDFGSQSGSLTIGAANIGTNPAFVNAGAGNYALANTSPAVNTGAPTIAGGYPALDLAGNPRVIGSHIDMGAYESSVDDLHNLTVTTTADNNDNVNPTTGSLRWALKVANGNTTLSKITFALPNCGTALINITTPLPDITKPILIDGYYDFNGNITNGSTLNTSSTGFNATVCAILNGSTASSQQAYAFRTSGSSAQLTVRGLGFVGFGTAAIELNDGSNHHVTGNQFGGFPFTLQNQTAIWVTGSSNGALIGGDIDPSIVNLIVGSIGAGIQIDNAAGGSIVADNLIGIAGDGSSSNGNYVGVYVYNSPNNLIRYNAIGNNASYGVQISGASATNNVMQLDSIGTTWSGASAANASGGIGINFGAWNNQVGAALGDTNGGNFIVGNGGPGVWISTSGGADNSVLSNTIAGNSGLAIDLAAAGPTANGATSSGPNNAQNYPMLLNAFRTKSSEWIEGTLDQPSNPGDTYRLEFFYSTICSSLGSPARGAGGLWLGTAQALADGNGHAHFWVKLPATSGPAYQLSATATDSHGDTSEIGECHPESTDMIFRDGFEG